MHSCSPGAMRSTTASSCRQRCAARFAAKWWGRANDALSLASLPLYSTHTHTHVVCICMCTIYCVYCTCVIYVNATKGRGLHVVQWPRLVLCWTIKYPIKKSKKLSSIWSQITVGMGYINRPGKHGIASLLKLYWKQSQIEAVAYPA